MINTSQLRKCSSFGCVLGFFSFFFCNSFFFFLMFVSISDVLMDTISLAMVEFDLVDPPSFFDIVRVLSFFDISN